MHEDRLPWVHYQDIGDGDAEKLGQEMLDLLCEVTDAARSDHLRLAIDRVISFVTEMRRILPLYGWPPPSTP